MAVLALDTLKATRELTAAGAAPSLAEAIVATVNSAVNASAAGKAPTAETGAHIGKGDPKLKADLARIKADFATIRADMAEIKADIEIISWILAVMAPLFLAMAARLFEIV